MIIEARLTDQDIERIANRLAALLLRQQARAAQWLGVAGAADHVGLTEHSVRGLVKRQKIPFHRTSNGRLRFSVTELDDWVRTGSCAVTHEDYHDAP